MCSTVLLHVILSRESFVTHRTMHTLFSGMFLSMASCMSRCGESGSARMGCGVWTRVFVLLRNRLGHLGGWSGVEGSRGW